MSITIHKPPQVLETYFIEEARTIPTAHWGNATNGSGFLGPSISKLTGEGIMAGWALTVSCPGDSNLAVNLALQYMLDTATVGKWVMVVVPHEDSEATHTALWDYIQSMMGWEVGFVGAVVLGYVRDIDEIEEKLKSEFSIFGYGGSMVPTSTSVDGEIGAPVTINGVTIRTGDLIVGDSDGVIRVSKDVVEGAVEKCRIAIVDEVNMLQHVREGMGAVDVLGLREMLTGNVDLVD